MAGAEINVRDTSEEIRRAIEKLEKRVGNLKPAFDDIGEYLLISHDQRFRDQVDPQGDPWAALSESYRKRKKRNADKILVLDDILAGTLRYQASARRLGFGTDRIYGATHQFGDESRGIPEREHLGLSAADSKEVLRLVDDHLVGGLG